MNKILCVLAAALALSSCGKLHEKFGRLKGGTTAVNLALSGQHGLTAVLPGIMVYAIRVGNPASKGARLVGDETASLNWLIPNGNYDFYAFGYTGPGLTGTLHCGSAQNVALSGGSTVVNLVLDDTGVCGTPPFSPPGFGVGGGDQPLSVKVAACDQSGSFTTVAPPSTGCDASGGRPGVANIETLKMELPVFSRWNPGEEPVDKGPGLQSICITGPYNGMGTDTGLKIPAGPFPVKVETYSMPGCTGFMGSYVFLGGISAAHDNQASRFVDNNNANVAPALQMALGTYGSSSTYLFLRTF